MTEAMIKNRNYVLAPEPFLRSVDSAISFASDMIHAIPGCVCLYLVKPDIVIPNTRWKNEVGEVYRLVDLLKFGFDLASLTNKLDRALESSQTLDLPEVDEESGFRKLLFVPVPGHPEVFVMYVKDDIRYVALSKCEKKRF